MLYLLAVFLPPLAVLFCGRPLLAVVTLLIWPLGIIPAVIVALGVVSNYNAVQRNQSLIRAMNPQAVQKSMTVSGLLTAFVVLCGIIYFANRPTKTTTTATSTPTVTAP